LAFVQMYLTRVGIKTKVRQMPWPDLEKAGQAGKLELWLTGYSKDVIGDHMAYFGPEGTWNYGKYNNSKYHDLMTKASRSGGEELKKIYFEQPSRFGIGPSLIWSNQKSVMLSNHGLISTSDIEILKTLSFAKIQRMLFQFVPKLLLVLDILVILAHKSVF